MEKEYSPLERMRILFDKDDKEGKPYYNTLVKAAYRSTQDLQKAEDIVQEAYMRAERSIGNYRNVIDIESSLIDNVDLKKWLYPIFKRQIIDSYRKENGDRRMMRKERGVECLCNDFENLRINYETPEKIAIDKEGGILGNKEVGLISRLNPVLREVLHLRYFEDFSYEDIANRLNLTFSLVSDKIRQSKVVLRRLLKEEGYVHTY